MMSNANYPTIDNTFNRGARYQTKGNDGNKDTGASDSKPLVKQEVPPPIASAKLTRADSYQSRGSYGFLVMKL